MNVLKKAITLIFSLALLLSAASCGKDPDDGSTEVLPGIPSDSPAGFDGGVLGSVGSTRYVAESVRLPGNPDSIIADKQGGKIYLLGSKYDDDYAETERRLYVYDPDAGRVSELWRGAGGEAAVLDIAADGGGNVWLSEVKSEYLEDGEAITQRLNATLIRIGADGDFKSWTLDSLGGLAPSELLFHNDRLYLNCYGNEGYRLISLAIIDGEPRLDDVKLDIEVSDFGSSFAVTGDDQICMFNVTGSSVSLLDEETGRWAAAHTFETRVTNVYSGDDAYSLYLDDGGNLYGFDLDSGQSTKILNWISCGIAENPQVLPLGGGAFFSVSLNRAKNKDICDILCIADAGSSENVTLTLGTLGHHYDLTDTVIEFNRAHDDIKIELLDYSVYDTNADYPQGLEKLDAEIRSGNAPDVIDLSGLSAVGYAASGVLEDLYPFIEGDSEYNHAAFHENILSAFALGGKLYELPLEFSIYTAVGKTDVISGKQGWGFEEYRETAENSGVASPFGGGYSPGAFLESVIYFYINDFISWETLTCNFESELFVELLELCAEMEASPEPWNTYDALHGGRQFITLAGVSDIYSVRYNRGLYGDDGFAFIGLPGASGSGTAAAASYSFGISATSQYKDEAWEFLRSFLSVESQSQLYGIPITKAGFEEKLTQTVARENKLKARGEQQAMYVDGAAVEVACEPESDAKMLRELASRQDRAVRRDDNIAAIIMDEAALFFAGEKSATETAQLIQERTQVYLRG